jgi:succinate dehydrogenase / fumarate reductase iron-sulfur subunit
VKITLHVWRQQSPEAAGRLETYRLDDVTPDMSFLEMFDVLNETLVEQGKEPVAFSHDCREGICGSCAMMINGAAHGPMKGAATCQLHMRSFKDGDEIVVEPWRARAFPIVKDLVVDRSALDRDHPGGRVHLGEHRRRPRRERDPRREARRDAAMDAAACIGCGACVAGVPERVGVAVHGREGQPPRAAAAGAAERFRRVVEMVEQMDLEGFGHCTWYGECQEACPKLISIDVISRMNRDFLRGSLAMTQAAAEYAG